MGMGFAYPGQTGAAGTPGASGVGLTTARLDPELGQPLSAGAFPAYGKTDGTNFPISLLGFDAATVESIFFKFFPSTYVSGNFTVTIEWYSATGQTSGDVVWGAAVAAISPGEAQSVETKGFAGQLTTTTTVNGTAKGLTQTVITVTNTDSAAAGDLVWIQIQRVANSGSDTMTGDANLVFCTVSWT